jgi:hypothetical protein
MHVDRRLSLLFHHVIPASLYGGHTAWRTLSKIGQELGKVKNLQGSPSGDVVLWVPGRERATTAKT